MAHGDGLWRILARFQFVGLGCCYGPTRMKTPSLLNKWCPIKVNFLTWRLFLNRLPTKEALLRRNFHITSSECVFLEETVESGDHLFAACSFTQEIWEELLRWCRIATPFFFCVRGVLDLHTHCRGSRRWQKIVDSVVQMVIWCIWRMRNDAVFNNKRAAVKNVVEKIKVLSFLWLKHRAKALTLTWEDWCRFDLICMKV
ncbi:uncharacterized protein LOC110921327 [Helianthus annuus]|uniref:uncharacterized protein LOC110921327 n=1 Tax=Helianthus annuus TaxID=4232 RepID=UPI000B8FD292|nr:uncharacterized protein LOC110921327 [Helianthus annuus]